MEDGLKSPARVRPTPAGAFTLAELLVVIAVVAALLAVLLPALRGTRDRAKDVLCLSNLRQLAAAWTGYTDDHRVFPVHDPFPQQIGQNRAGWGGVHWEGTPVGGTSPLQLPAERPVNPYVAGEARIDGHARVFQCPRDTGGWDHLYGANPWAVTSASTSSGDPNSCHGVAGTSYESNEWVFCTPGSPTGWSGLTGLPMVNYRPNQSPAHVQVSPSRFVILTDIAPSNWVRCDPARRFSLYGAWWHGEERTQMAFLDGSARMVRTGRMVSAEYSPHMAAIRQPNLTWIRPSMP
jgi:type II secretory pathway pseudopilin PulG